MEMLIYILKVNLYAVLFYLCYWVLLRKHTFFELNRFYLVGTLCLSLALPLIRFTETISFIPAAEKTLQRPDLFLAHEEVGPSINWLSALFVIYLIGAAYMFCNLLLGFYRLNILIKSGEKIRLDNYTLILLPESAASGNFGSFSFFNLLVVTQHDYDNYFDTILRHENIHIEQKHSVDILLVELYKIVFWFNPVSWFYKYSIKEIHEFLADHDAENKEHYAGFLISYAQNVAPGSITNNFFNSFLLKDRIKMIYRKSTSNWALIKYMLVVPVIAVAVVKTAARNTVYKTSEANPKIENSTAKEILQTHEKLGLVSGNIKVKKIKPVTYTDRSSKGNTTENENSSASDRKVATNNDLPEKEDTLAKKNAQKPGLNQIKFEEKPEKEPTDGADFNKFFDGKHPEIFTPKLEIKAQKLRYVKEKDTLGP